MPARSRTDTHPEVEVDKTAHSVETPKTSRKKSVRPTPEILEEALELEDKTPTESDA